MFTTRFLDIPPLARGRRHGARAGLEEHLEPRPPARRLRRRHDDDRRAAPLRRHPGDARGAEAARLPHRRRRRRGSLVTGLGARPLDAAVDRSGSATPARRCARSSPPSRSAPPPGARFEFRGTPRMHERPIGDLVDALRSLGCAIEYLEQPGFPPLVVHPPPAPLDLDRPIVVRGDVSSQFLTSLLLALPLRAGAAGAVDRGRGRADLQALRRHHAAPARALRRRRRARRLAALSRRRRRTALRLAGPLRRRGRRLVGVVLHRRRRRSPRATRRCASKASAASRSRATSPSSTPSARWARRSTPRRTALTVRRGRFPLAPITLDCNHIPDAAMTLAALALFADGHRRGSTNIASWRVKETDRLAAMASRAAQARRDVVEKAPTSLAITPPAHWRAASIETYDDHRMAMAMSLAAFNGAAGAGAADAGADRRPALRRQDLARLLRGAVRGRLGRARRRSRC